MRQFIKKYRWTLLITLIATSSIGFASFKKILDRTVKHRTMPIEYLIVHWTANITPGADAAANAIYLQRKEAAGTHYCIDDEETFRCTEDRNVAYGVGGKPWKGFIPKPWIAGKVFNNNTLNFEMCFGYTRNDSVIIDKTANLVAKKLVEYGLDTTRVLRHYDVIGKPCPKFAYRDMEEWNIQKEDSLFRVFLRKVSSYYTIHTFRKEIWKKTGQWIDTIPNYVGQSTLKYTIE